MVDFHFELDYKTCLNRQYFKKKCSFIPDLRDSFRQQKRM